MTNYKYLIIGHFTNGEPWEETAKNKRELAFVLNKEPRKLYLLDAIRATTFTPYQESTQEHR